MQICSHYNGIKYYGVNLLTFSWPITRTITDMSNEGCASTVVTTWATLLKGSFYISNDIRNDWVISTNLPQVFQQCFLYLGTVHLQKSTKIHLSTKSFNEISCYMLHLIVILTHIKVAKLCSICIKCTIVHLHKLLTYFWKVRIHIQNGRKIIPLNNTLLGQCLSIPQSPNKVHTYHLLTVHSSPLVNYKENTFTESKD